MSSAVPWMLFAVPAIAVAICWRKLAMGWRTEPRTLAGIACLTFTSGAILLAFAALAWVQFVRPIPMTNYKVESSGLLLSVAGVIAGFAIRQKRQHRYFGLGLGAAVWTSALYFLAASTY